MSELPTKYMDDATAKGVTVSPTGWHEYVVCQDGRVICQCSGKNAKADARKIANGLVALDEVIVLEQRNDMLADALKPGLMKRILGAR
jgi:hypothetical protein